MIQILPEAVQCNIKVSSQEELFDVMSTPLVQAGKVKPDFSCHVLDREQRFPTGLPFDSFGAAIPHTDPENVISPSIAVATLQDPVDFQVMGSPELNVAVSLVFMLALDDGHAHIKFLQQVVKLAQDKEKVSELFSAKSDRDLFQSVKRFLEIEE